MPWAKQGVFLLDSILTVRENEGLSHKSMGWELFTRATIMAINSRCDHVVFMLWGSKAQTMGYLIDKEKHIILKECHPSPLAGHTFKMTRCFSECNDFLMKHEIKPINWDIMT